MRSSFSSSFSASAAAGQDISGDSQVKFIGLVTFGNKPHFGAGTLSSSNLNKLAVCILHNDLTTLKNIRHDEYKYNCSI